jgi:hypothetical protein
MTQRADAVDQRRMLSVPFAKAMAQDWSDRHAGREVRSRSRWIAIRGTGRCRWSSRPGDQAPSSTTDPLDPATFTVASDGTVVDGELGCPHMRPGATQGAERNRLAGVNTKPRRVRAGRTGGSGGNRLQSTAGQKKPDFHAVGARRVVPEESGTSPADKQDSGIIDGLSLSLLSYIVIYCRANRGNV